ncbi:MAG: universal stress protein [Chitinophagaceae bacterium]
MKEIKNILLATDFSELSGNAQSTAIAMCKRQKAVLHLLHIMENRPVSSKKVPEPDIKGKPKLPAEAAADQLARVESDIREKEGIEVVSYLESGIPEDLIREKAESLNCDLIVMGTRGASNFREFFNGSKACNVIKHTTIPVLTIPGKKKINDFKKILFPIRVTRGILAKYHFIEPIIDKNHSELYIAGLSLPGGEYNLGPEDENILELGRSLRTRNTKFNSEFFVCRNYAKKVLDLAKKEKVDLIVINASLDYKWRQFFLGPYTQQVVDHSGVPVLSIRDPKPKINFAETVKGEIRNAYQDSMAY